MCVLALAILLLIYPDECYTIILFRKLKTEKRHFRKLVIRISQYEDINSRKTPFFSHGQNCENAAHSDGGLLRLYRASS